MNDPKELLMDTDAYVLAISMYERTAEAQRRAALDHLLRAAKPPRSRPRLHEVLSRILKAAAGPWRMKRYTT